MSLVRILTYLLCLSCLGNLHYSAYALRNIPKRSSTLRHRDSIVILPTVEILRSQERFAILPMPFSEETVLYSTKKADRLRLSETLANTAINSVRQTFALAPGVFIWENDGSGVQANIGIRGLSPNRSWELNVRQDGYDISSDPFGYPEAYYTPPFAMLEHIDLVRGASSLQFGPQFGGMINYRTKSAPTNRPFSGETQQSIGAGNLYASYTALGGTLSIDTTQSLSYYTGFDYRCGDGWRSNSSFRQGTGLAKLTYTMSATSIELSFTAMHYLLQQPAGLTERQYADDPRQSFRSRDWFSTTWLVPALTLSHQFSTHSRLTVKAFGLVGDRESIGLIASTAIADTGTNRRRTNTDAYRNIGIEARWLSQQTIAELPMTLAVGARYSLGQTVRRQGRGADGSQPIFDIIAPPTRDLQFSVANTAFFAETGISLTPHLTLTAGLRIESLRSTGNGTFTREYSMTSVRAFDTLGTATMLNARGSEFVPLMGIGISAFIAPKTLPSLEVYGNIAQTYRPVLFGDQFQSDLTAVDPNIRSSRGLTTDLGIRGSYHGLRWDMSLFFLQYNDRVGTLPLNILSSEERSQLPLDATALRTNIAESHHKGMELLLEISLPHILSSNRIAELIGTPSLFVSTSYTSAYYVRDSRSERNVQFGTAVQSVAGNRVEFAPAWITRAGIQWQFHALSAQVQWSMVGESFSNSANTITQADGQQGVIPAYSVADATLRWHINTWLSMNASINNLFDRRYFTRRATGYPGPGIIPADGRMWTCGVRVVW